MSDAADRRFGYAVTLLGVLWLSPDALLQRLIDDDPLRILGWRGALSVVVLGLYLLCRYRGRVLRAFLGGWRLVFLSLIYAVNSSAFVFALGHAAVADVLVILAATPLCAALLGWLLLREVPVLRVWIAIALGISGVLVAAVGGASGGTLFGMALAMVTTVMLATQFTLIRLWPQVDNVAPVLLGSILMGVIGFTVADPMAIEGTSRLWAIALGLFLTPIAFTLVMVGPRYLGSAEVSLMMLLETALGPLWVWLFLNEEPALTTLIGGGIVVLAVVVSVSSSNLK